MLSWDTGCEGEAAEPGERHFRGRLYSYDLATHRRTSWQLPRLTVRGGEEPITGTFGFSTHTANAVFWLATQTLDCEKLCDVGTSAVYAAQL